MITVSEKTKDQLFWALNTNENRETPFFTVGIYSHDKYIIKQTAPGSLFADVINKLESLGFRLFAVNCQDDRIYIVVESYRKNMRGLD